MAVTRTLDNGNVVTEWTEEVNEIDNQYGLLNGTDLFVGEGVSQESVIFEKNYITRTLIPQASRRGGDKSKGKDRKTDVFSLALPYFSHQDYVTPQDIQGWRQTGTADQPKLLVTAINDKFEDMRNDFDQTREFMKMHAVKGITVDADGTVIADMFSEFGLTRTDYQIDFDLDNAAADVDGKIAELKRGVAKNAKAGGRIGRIEVMVSPEFFDKLINHPKIREAYLYYSASAPTDSVRADLASYEAWGVVDTFVHKGIMFYSYDAEFTRDVGDGTTEVVKGLGETGSSEAALNDPQADVGYTIVRGVRGAYRAYFGPANTLSGANVVGQEIMAYQYRDAKDKYHELEIESAPLYVLTKPQLSYRVLG